MYCIHKGITAEPGAAYTKSLRDPSINMPKMPPHHESYRSNN